MLKQKEESFAETIYENEKFFRGFGNGKCNNALAISFA